MQLIISLDSIAAEAQANQALSQASLSRLLDQTLGQGADARVTRQRLFDWHQRVMKMPKGAGNFPCGGRMEKTQFCAF